jgi:ketosteroid isomerase-like protein
MDDTQSDLADLRHQWELWQLPHRYAQALDRRDRAALADLFTRDAVFERVNVETRSYDGICGLIEVLAKKYDSTFHAVMNQTFSINGLAAEGEVYCIAHHLYRAHDDQVGLSHDLRIRYQDQYRLCDDERWRFTRRKVFVDSRSVHQVVVSDG